MEEKRKFGELNAVSLSVGDIVSWSKWNPGEEIWDQFVGVLLEVRNEMKGNRLVSISRVMPLSNATTTGELEFFTLSLKLVSPSNNKKQ
jgi:hypothetical protein|tara:strand:- start:15640 stop:15906 length:267 start_codon:yes stop_codon:yes gene_type:complete